MSTTPPPTQQQQPPSPPPEWDRILSAAQQNNATLITDLVNNEHINPSHANTVGQSALHIAALWGHVPALQALIDAGATTSPQNRITGGTPLHCAVQSQKKPISNRVTCVRLLIDAGADVTVPDNHGGTPVDYVGASVSHMMGGTEEDVKMLVEMGRMLMDAVPKSKLHDLIGQQGVEEVGRYLDELRGQQDEDGENKNSMSEVLNAVDSRCGNTTPVQYAVSLLMDQILPPRRSNNDSGKDDDEGRRDELSSIVMLLLDAGADVNATMTSTTPSDESSSGVCTTTALHSCVVRTCEHEYNNEEEAFQAALGVIRLLLDDGRADPNIPSVDEMGGGTKTTPLLTAIISASSSADSEKRRHRCLEVASLLVSHGGKLLSSDTNAASPVTVLHDASRRGNVPIVTFLLKHAKQMGVDVNAPGRQGLTPLHFAARSGRVDVARVLLDAGADVSATDGRGKTPLDAATVNEKVDVVTLLQEYAKNKSK